MDGGQKNCHTRREEVPGDDKPFVVVECIILCIQPSMVSLYPTKTHPHETSRTDSCKRKAKKHKDLSSSADLSTTHALLRPSEIYHTCVPFIESMIPPLSLLSENSSSIIMRAACRRWPLLPPHHWLLTRVRDNLSLSLIQCGVEGGMHILLRVRELLLRVCISSSFSPSTRGWPKSFGLCCLR